MKLCNLFRLLSIIIKRSKDKKTKKKIYIYIYIYNRLVRVGIEEKTNEYEIFKAD